MAEKSGTLRFPLLGSQEINREMAKKSGTLRFPLLGRKIREIRKYKKQKTGKKTQENQEKLCAKENSLIDVLQR